MKNFLTIPALALALGLTGCASTGQVDKLESTSETNSKLLRENEFRLQQLESSMASLNSQMAQLNNRVYEVRTRNGKKTSMTVVPILPPAAPTAPAAVAAGAPAGAAAAGVSPAAQTAQPTSRAEALLAQARKVAAERNQAAQGGTDGTAQTAAQPAAATPGAAPDAQAAAAAQTPKGRMIDPAAAPTPIPSPAAPRAAAQQAPAQRAAGATGSVGRPVAGPSGTLAAQPAQGPAALPPIDLPPTAQPAATPTAGAQPAAAPRTNSVTGAASSVPVPAIPASNLALPPEHPGLPPVGQPQTAGTDAARQSSPAATHTTAQAASPAPAARTASPRGEEAAYKAALNATLAGRTDEGMRLFHDFLQQYPHGRYAANADYWIGEGLYAQGKYPEALAQFQKVNDTYPQHHKNADALLKAGMTMNRLGDRPAAAEKYRTLMTQFPNSDAARRARAMGVAH